VAPPGTKGTARGKAAGPVDPSRAELHKQLDDLGL